MRYFGALDNESMLHKNEVLYRFSTKAEQLFESELSEPVEKRSSKYDMDTIFTKAGADVVKNIDNYSLDDIEAKLSVICVRNKVNFNLTEEKDEEETPTVYNLENENNIEPEIPDWIKALNAVVAENNF